MEGVSHRLERLRACILFGDHARIKVKRFYFDTFSISEENKTYLNKEASCDASSDIF